MQFGIFSVGDVTTDPTTGTTVSEHERIEAMTKIALKAEEVGLDVFATGEHHNPPFVPSSPTTLLGWIAAKTDSTMAYYEREDIPFHYALADAEPFGNHHALRGHRAHADFSLFQLELVAASLYHPDVGLIARAIIRVKHRFNRHHHRVLTGAGGQVCQIDRHGPTHAAH